MALPTSPRGGLPKRPQPPQSQQNNDSPTNSGGENRIRSEEERKRRAAELRKAKALEKKKAALAESRRRRTTSNKIVKDKDGREWAIDQKTGKKYRLLPAASEEMLKASKSNGGFLSKEQLERMHKTVDDFDVNDLNSAAELFMGHLRVPMSDEERDAYKKERERRLAAINKKYAEDHKYEE